MDFLALVGGLQEYQRHLEHAGVAPRPPGDPTGERFPIHGEAIAVEERLLGVPRILRRLRTRERLSIANRSLNARRTGSGIEVPLRMQSKNSMRGSPGTKRLVPRSSMTQRILLKTLMAFWISRVGGTAST